MKLGGTTKLFVLLDFSNRTFIYALVAHDGKSSGLKISRERGSIPPQGTIKILKGETIMKAIVDYNLIALTQVIVSAFTFRFFPSGK